MEYKGITLFSTYLTYIFDFIVYVLFAYYLQNYLNSGLPFFKFLQKIFTFNKNSTNKKNKNSKENENENSKEICKKKFIFKIKKFFFNF